MIASWFSQGSQAAWEAERVLWKVGQWEPLKELWVGLHFFPNFLFFLGDFLVK